MEPKEKPISKFETLKEKFPNMVDPTLFSDEKNLDTTISNCESLLTLAELMDIADKVYTIAIHGSTPALLVIVGKDNPEDEKSGYNIKTIYFYTYRRRNPDNTYTVHETYTMEKWDPHNYEGFGNLAEETDKPENKGSQENGIFSITMTYPEK